MNMPMANGEEKGEEYSIKAIRTEYRDILKAYKLGGTQIFHGNPEKIILDTE